MNLKLIVAILVIGAVPVCAQAQNPSAAKSTRADAQKVVKMIGSDKAKIQTYCDIGKLGDQIEKANEKRDFKTAEELTAWNQLDFFNKNGLGYAIEMNNRPQTLYAIAESPMKAGVIWTGSTDGQVNVTQDAGGAELCLRPEFTIPVCRLHRAEADGWACRSGCFSRMRATLLHDWRWMVMPLPRVTKPTIGSGGAGLQQRLRIEFARRRDDECFEKGRCAAVRVGAQGDRD